MTERRESEEVVCTEKNGTTKVYTLDELLEDAVKFNASDLHLQANTRPVFRVQGRLREDSRFDTLNGNQVRGLLYSILNDKEIEFFERAKELDISYQTKNSRFRVNMYKERGNAAGSFRTIPFEIPTKEWLGFPNDAVWNNIINMKQGLVLVTGVTGSGKSTTLASMINAINKIRSEKVVTVEDPVEYVYKNEKSIIIQREVGEHNDTDSFYNGLKYVLRQDPDIILVGEMRDKETAALTLTAAETGHLVFSTLHTKDATGTITRLIDLFPPQQQQEIKTQVSMVLSYVLSQKLLSQIKEGGKRVLAMEVMYNDKAIANLIRQGKPEQMRSIIQTSSNYNMFTLEQHLKELVEKGKITAETALSYANDIQDMESILGMHEKEEHKISRGRRR